MKTCSLVFTLCCAACSQVFGQTLPDYVAALPLPVPGDSWVWAGSPPDDRSRLFAMEGGGSIRILDIAYSAGSLPEFTLRTTPFVTLTTNQARSVAFAPDFAISGKVYIAHETTGGSRIVEVRVSASDPNVADPASVRLIRMFPNLTFDHALGSMHFGRDGMLYIGVGDAMSSANGQLINTVHGKMLRIDVSGADDYPDDANKNFAIPPSNPLIARPLAAPEIWHIGLRNPWRWSFDRKTGDVKWEEKRPGVGFAHKPPRYLKAGEVLSTFIEGIGTMRHRMVAGHSRQ